MAEIVFRYFLFRIQFMAMTPNPQQKLVIDHVDGPCIVLAVPGSGKTASVTERIKGLIEKGVDPRSILAITFTNKAASEMRSRIGQAVGPDKAGLMTISTFHSFCARIIRANCEHVGLGVNFSIYDDDDRERLLKKCIRKVEDPGNENSKYKPGKDYMSSLIGYIEWQRNGCLTEGEALEKYPLSGNQSKVVAEYYSDLKKSNAIDFTGLLSETLRMFKEQPQVLDKYRRRFRFISVDEVQDTNIAQYEIVKLLGSEHKNVLVVGDVSQSIYMFRGAYPDNVIRFEKDFGAKVLKLEKNYRSTPSILKHSQALIEHNVLPHKTELFTDNPDAPPPQIVASENDMDMASDIAARIERHIRAGVNPKEIVVLYRVNAASRVLETALMDEGIKYKILGGHSFWKRKEIKCSLAILKLMCNDNDMMSFETACEACCRGVGDKSLGIISEMVQTRSMPILTAARQFANAGSAAGRAFLPLTNAMTHVGGLLPGQALLDVARKTLFWERLESDSTYTNDRCENLLEMVRDVDDYCSKPKCSLAGYLQNVSLLTDADEEEGDVVKLMTLHGCKGLEFDVVFISHCQSNMLPHVRGCLEARNEQERRKVIEEERRLLYVGMTRARKNLSLHFARSKVDARSRTAKQCFPSSFLFETGIKSSALNGYSPGQQRTFE
jgi:DNA helicase-2/ATP-dependent DNA helicase PcrA